MRDNRDQRVKEIQEAVREILLKDWDPIEVANVPEAQDEYDSYVGAIYRLLGSKPSEDKIIEHLFTIETGAMGLAAVAGLRESLRPIAKKLIALDVSL